MSDCVTSWEGVTSDTKAVGIGIVVMVVAALVAKTGFLVHRGVVQEQA